MDAGAMETVAAIVAARVTTKVAPKDATDAVLAPKAVLMDAARAAPKAIAVVAADAAAVVAVVDAMKVRGKVPTAEHVNVLTVSPSRVMSTALSKTPPWAMAARRTACAKMRAQSAQHAADAHRVAANARAKASVLRTMPIVALHPAQGTPQHLKAIHVRSPATVVVRVGVAATGDVARNAGLVRKITRRTQALGSSKPSWVLLKHNLRLQTLPQTLVQPIAVETVVKATVSLGRSAHATATDVNVARARSVGSAMPRAKHLM